MHLNDLFVLIASYVFSLKLCHKNATKISYFKMIEGELKY